MSPLYVVPVFVAAVFLGAAAMFCRMTRPRPETRAERLADPAPMPGEVPFPVNTGPLMIRSERRSANEALERDTLASLAELEREIAGMIRRAEQQIPERWR